MYTVLNNEDLKYRAVAVSASTTYKTIWNGFKGRRKRRNRSNECDPQTHAGDTPARVLFAAIRRSKFYHENSFD